MPLHVYGETQGMTQGGRRIFDPEANTEPCPKCGHRTAGGCYCRLQEKFAPKVKVRNVFAFKGPRRPRLVSALIAARYAGGRWRAECILEPLSNPTHEKRLDLQDRGGAPRGWFAATDPFEDRNAIREAVEETLAEAWDVSSARIEIRVER